MWKSPPPFLTHQPPKPKINDQYNKLTHCVLIRPATLTRCVHYLKNSLTLESVLWTLIPPCGALSLSCRWRCLRGVHVKERYAPERSSLVRIAILRTKVGEEVGPSSGLLTCSMLCCENTCTGKSTWTLQNSTVFQLLEKLKN